jgi:hypothetical protein
VELYQSDLPWKRLKIRRLLGGVQMTNMIYS